MDVEVDNGSLGLKLPTQSDDVISDGDILWGTDVHWPIWKVSGAKVETLVCSLDNECGGGWCSPYDIWLVPDRDMSSGTLSPMGLVNIGTLDVWSRLL